MPSLVHPPDGAAAPSSVGVGAEGQAGLSELARPDLLEGMARRREDLIPPLGRPRQALGKLCRVTMSSQQPTTRCLRLENATVFRYGRGRGSRRSGWPDSSRKTAEVLCFLVFRRRSFWARYPHLDRGTRVGLDVALGPIAGGYPAHPNAGGNGASGLVQVADKPPGDPFGSARPR